ncbi:glycosyl hydrolase [Gelidibacter salicanalis]|nr:glycosyl hydrolase [Gelidibacter salicanalis]
MVLKVHAQDTKILHEFYNAKYEPETGIYHGAGQDIDGFKDYMNAVGKELTPVIYMTYVNINQDIEGITKWGEKLRKDLESLPEGLIPQIGLAFTGGKDKGAGRDKDVAEGKLDNQLKEFYKQLLKLDRPTYTRIGYEFEGDWNGYTPKYYRAVFKKIFNDFKIQNIKSATVWCSGGGSANFMNHEELMEFYPGDSYVDWWGIDIFSPDEFSNPALKAFFELAEDHKKPVMIGEATPRYVGVSEGKKSWDNWFKPYFEMLNDNPGIKAFCYINWDWAYWSDKIGFQWHDWKDARIETNAIVLDAYKIAISKENIIHLKDMK